MMQLQGVSDSGAALRNQLDRRWLHLWDCCPQSPGIHIPDNRLSSPGIKRTGLC